MPSNVWLVQQDRARDRRADGRYVKGVYHPQKMPIELARRMIGHCRLPPKSVILDPFMGTGTTGVEALEMGYSFLGSELEPEQVARNAAPNLEAVQRRLPPGHGLTCDYRAGDARDLSWCPDATVAACVTSPPYGRCDPSRDSKGRSLAYRIERGEAYASFIKRTSALAQVAGYSEGSIGLCDPEAWDDAMLRVMREVRRCLVPGGWFLVAAREYWEDRGMIDVPGRVAAMAPAAQLIVHDMIYALDVAIDRLGLQRSRASLHQNRLAKKQHASGRSCPRGVPGVTRVIVLQRRPRKGGT